jgi:integrase
MAKGRRGHGEGSIFKRKVGGKMVGWTAILDLGFENGKRKRLALYGRDRGEVQAKLDDERSKLRRGLSVGGPKLTTAEWLERWLRDVAKPKVRPSTYRRYKDLSEQHIAPMLGRIPLERLTPADVRQLLNAKLAEGLAPRTVHHVRSVLRTALHHAERDGLIQRNAAALAESPRVERKEMKSFTPEQARTFQQAIKTDPEQALYLVALDSGMRQGEILGLRWHNVDLEAGSLSLTHALQRVEGELVLVELKTTKSKRTLKLGVVAAKGLRDQRAWQVNERLRLGERWIDHGLVFTGAHGLPLENTALTKRFQALLARIGLPRMRFHDLRHSSATLLMSQHIPARVVMERLGHSTINLTLDTYSHVIQALNQEAADAMDRVLNG